MKKIASTSFFYIFKQKFNNEKKKIKILLSISAMVLMTTNVIAEEELHINVNYGGQKDLYYDITTSTLLKTLDFSKNATQKTTIDLPSLTFSWNWNQSVGNLDPLRTQACANVYTIDGMKALSAFVLANSDNNISLPTNAFTNAQLFDKAKASTLTVNNVPFIPTITIKRGNFDLKEGTLGGVHIKKHTDLNLLMQNTIIDEGNSSLTSSGIYQGMDINAVLAKRIIEQFNFKYWTYIVPSSESGLYAYIPTFRTKLQTILASKKTTPYETNVLTYINDIIDLGHRYSLYYLPISSYTQNATQNCLFEGDEIISKVEALNVKLKGSNTMDTDYLSSFMRSYDISKTIMNFEKFFYRVDYRQSSSIQSYDDSASYYGYSVNNVKLNLNRIYALKLIDKNGKASGTYANVIEFNEASTPQQGTVTFKDGELVAPAGVFGGAAGGGSYQDMVNLFNTTQTDSSTYSSSIGDGNVSNPVTAQAMINESYASPKTEHIELSCKPYYELEKFVNNVVYVDANAMKIGNNQFSVKTSSDMLDYEKNNMFMTNEVVTQIKNKLTVEHLIGNYLQNLTNTPFASSGAPLNPNYSNAYDTMYFYQKLIDTTGVGSECTNLFSGSKITKPSVVYLANSLDVFSGNGTLVSNVPHLPFNSKQEIQPMNSIMIETTTPTRDTDGNPDAEIEKRLSISANYPNSDNAYMYTQNNLDGSGKDKINWFPDTTVVSTYFPMWRPVDDLTYNNYGPVGPFFNKKDIIYKEKYEGCDLEQRAVGSTIALVAPQSQICSITSCTSETSTTDANGVVTVTCNSQTTKPGHYSDYSSGSCYCDAEIPNPGLASNAGLTKPSLAANRNLAVNRFCTYDMEAMKYKLRKRKYNYEHSSDDEGKIDINGFDSTSLDPEYSTYGNFDEIKGYVDSEITIPNRASYPLTFNDTVHYTNQLVDPFDIYWNTTNNDDFNMSIAGINGVTECEWNDNVDVQFKNSQINQVNDIIQPTIVEPILSNMAATGGIEAAKVLMYSELWETTEWTVCDISQNTTLDENDSNACGNAVISAIPALSSYSNAPDLTTKYLNYLKEGSKLKLGNKIPLRLNDNGVEVKNYVGASIYNDNTWTNETDWMKSGTRIFNNLNLDNPVDTGWVAIDYTNLTVSP